ncbi:MAG: DnaB-like helicase C-terminal domain-containing protein [Clostridia bacterium]|nr:DnaB-like helicase C-terminal domain-containing protein [Clostridia bacterium]
MDNYAVKLFESLQKLKVTDENKAEVEKIKQDIRKKDFKKALDRIEKIKNSNVEKKNKDSNTVYKNAADVPDDDFFTNDEVKEEANTESQKEDNKEDGYNNDGNYDDNYGDDYDDYDEFSEDPLFNKLKAYNDEEDDYSEETERYDTDNFIDDDESSEVSVKDTEDNSKNKKERKKNKSDIQNNNEKSENEANEINDDEESSNVAENEDKDVDTEESEEEKDDEENENSNNADEINNIEDNEDEIQEEEDTTGIYPKQLKNETLEHIYLGLLLTNPKLIAKYYVTKKQCYFEDDKCTEIYKSVLFTEGSKYTPEIAKDGFNLPKYNNEIRELKDDLMAEYMDSNYSIEETYIELKKLFTLRKSYLENPIKENQDKIVEIINYVLYKSMSVEEVESAVNQVTVTGKFKQAVLNKDLTSFLEMGDNTLTNGLEFPFPILSGVFKGLRKGETMAFAMPSNSGKSRFTINLAAYTAFVHKKKVLIISNEMSEDKMKLCLITTIINNPEIQKLHGQEISKTEGELLEFKFRPDDTKKVKVDEDGFVVKEENESQEDFVKRLTEISTEFNKTIKAVEWANKEIDNSIYFINITDHTNDELKKVIMNFYYKEKIEYVFYDTLKTDTANIGKGEEIKKTATILSNLAQNFNMFIYSTLQLTESTTLPINLDVNDLAVSRTVKEVLDTLCLIKQINKETYDDYEYSLKEVDTKYFNLKKYTDPDVRYYACVVDKNRAGAKPKVLFRLNLAYNRWEELGYLRMKQQVK